MNIKNEQNKISGFFFHLPFMIYREKTRTD